MGRFWKSKIFIITFLSIIISGCATQDANLEKHTIQVTKQQEVSNMQYSSEFSSVRNDFLSSTGLDYEVFDNLQIQEGRIVSYDFTYYDYDKDSGSYIANPRWMCSLRELKSDESVLVVIDPWSDSPFSEINDIVSAHVDEYLLPAVEHAIECGIDIYIFTNDPETVSYTTKIVDPLQKLVDNGEAKLCYYTDYEDSSVFTKELSAAGKKNIIYAGYSTHLCLLYRTTGVLGIYYNETYPQFNLYIIPEATMAYVIEDDEINVNMRNDICIMLSQQGIASIITYDDFIEYKE